MIAIGQFHSGDEQLEPLGHGRVARPDASQRRLAGRIIEKQHGPIEPQARLHPLDHQQIEPSIAVFPCKSGRRLDAELFDRSGQRRSVGRVRVNTHVSLEGLAVADPLGQAHFQ